MLASLADRTKWVDATELASGDGSLIMTYTLPDGMYKRKYQKKHGT